MSLEQLLLKNLRGSDRLLFGEKAEVERLLGAPLPVLPRPCLLKNGSERYFAEVHQPLRDALHGYIASVSARMGKVGDSKGAGGENVELDELPYEGLLTETLGNVTRSDRRLGLVNLFWLIHSGEVADAVEKAFAPAGGNSALKYQMHPVLASLYRRVEKAVFGALNRADAVKVRYRRGSGFSTAIPDIIIDDQFSLMHRDMKGFNPEEVLVARNRRFRIGAAAFEELRDLLVASIADGLERRDDGLMDQLLATAPVPSPAELSAAGRLDRYVYQRPVVHYLLQDVEELAHRLERNRTLRREKERLGGWRGLLGSYFDVADALLRSQVIFCLRETVRISRKGFDDEQVRSLHGRGDLYQFSPRAEIVGNVRNVTVLFADVRDFTRASEGLISERGLAEELYAIFDPAAIALERFGGRIEKFLGDGFMATFGVEGTSDGRDPLAPARAALAIQHMLSRLRDNGKTSFQMGIGLHNGRAAVARFLLDGEREEVTPIGRQVNIAGRLCAAKGAVLEMSEEEARRRKEAQRAAGIKDYRHSVDGVSVDSDGNLLNAGIAVTGGFVDSVRKAYELRTCSAGEQTCGLRDDMTGLEMKFVYVGAARFKGLEGSVSIYSLSAKEHIED